MPIDAFTRPRMLVCDLDGTLLNSTGVMTTTTIAALHRAAEEGIEVVFATGRRHTFAGKVLGPIGLDAGTVLISSNGAITCTIGGGSRQRIAMPVETAVTLCSQLGAHRESLIFTFEREGPGALVVESIDALHRRIPRWVESNAHEIACCSPLERAFDTGEEPIQAMICGGLAEMEEAMGMLNAPEMAGLRRQLSIHRTQYAARNLSIVDLMAVGCSKGNAVAALAAERGFQAAAIACIGDNMNDADMLAFAGWPVVMSNAPAELLALAAEKGWEIAASNNEDGAALAILRMLDGISPGFEDVERVVVSAN